MTDPAILGVLAQKSSTTSPLSAAEIRAKVREGYSRAVPDPAAESIARSVGYSAAQLASLPPSANVGFGCGNPFASAQLEPGHTVLDLGSGAGVDVFLASVAVRRGGRAIGVEMTREMVARARECSRAGGAANAVFTQATIEELPLAAGSVDAVISNGVINYSPEKPRALREAHRVLRPGGRLVICDLAIREPVDPALRRTALSFLGFLGPAADYPAAVEAAGFRDVTVVSELEYGEIVLAGNEPFRTAALDSGASRDAIDAFLRTVTSLEIAATRRLG